MDITSADVAIFSTGKTRIKYCHGKIEEVYNQTHAQASRLAASEALNNDIHIFITNPYIIAINPR